MALKIETANFNLVRILELVLLLVLLAVLARAIIPFMAQKQVMVLAPTSNNETIGSSKQPKINISVLKSFDPFHRDKTIATNTAVITESTPETTLDLKVFGMRANINGDTSSAIIQTPDRKQATYFLGNEIIPGVTLKQVEIDYVILDRNGVAERLSRQGKAEGDTSISDAIAMAALAFKAQDMINDLRFYPHREGRTVIGYKMRSRRGQSLEKYGFRQNDIITAINGESLAQNRVNMPNILKNLKQARYASIQIIRDDMPMTIEVNLQ